MAAASPNWTQVGVPLPIASLADDYAGPIILLDKTQTVRWFVKKANKDPIEHAEHQRDDEHGFLHDDDGKPVTKSRTVAPAFWAFAEIIK